MTKPIKDCVKGDILVKDDRKLKVTARLEDLVFYAWPSDNPMYHKYDLYQELENDGLTVEEQPEPKWVPSIIEEIYFFVNDRFEMQSEVFLSLQIDIDRIKAGNCFEKWQECTAVADKIKKLLAE